MKQNVKRGPRTVQIFVLKASALLHFFCFEITFQHLHMNGQKQI